MMRRIALALGVLLTLSAAAPLAADSAKPGPNTQMALFQERTIFHSGLRNAHTIALTFDDGPNAHTGEVLDALKAMNVKAKQTLNRYLSKLDRGDPGTPEVPRHSHGSTHAACPHNAPSPTTAPLAGRTASWTRRGPSWSAFWTCVRRR